MGHTLRWWSADWESFSKDFVTLRDYIARHKAHAYVEHFSSSINFAMSMFKLSITTRWALMAARAAGLGLSVIAAGT